MKFQETTTTLGVSATFTGPARSDRSGRDFFVAVAVASHASASNGFRILASFDDVTYRAIAQMTLPAGAPRVISCPAIFPFYKVELVNGTTAQTYLSLASGFTYNVSEFGSGEALITTVTGTVNATQVLASGSTNGGLIKHVVAAAGTNATSVKASAGKLLAVSLANLTASWKFVKLHNVATAPTAGAGVVMTFAIPPNGRSEMEFSAVGVAFATGIGLTITGAAADADTTAVAANDVIADLIYI